MCYFLRTRVCIRIWTKNVAVRSLLLSCFLGEVIMPVLTVRRSKMFCSATFGYISFGLFEFLEALNLKMNWDLNKFLWRLEQDFNLSFRSVKDSKYTCYKGIDETFFYHRRIQLFKFYPLFILTSSSEVDRPVFKCSRILIFTQIFFRS